MNRWAWVALGALLAGCGSQPTARADRDAAPSAPTSKPTPPAKAGAPPEGTPPARGAVAAAQPGSAEHVGTYALRLSAAQRAEVEKGLESLRAQAKAGDQAAVEALPAVEAALAQSSSAFIRLEADGTYLASVEGSEARGKYHVKGDEVRFDAPEDGQPAAFPTLRLDRKRRALVANASGEEVEFVRQ